MQHVLVTAGASGIGREMVLAFAAQGARVGAIDLDADALNALARECPGVVTLRCDLTCRAAIEVAVPAVVDMLGGLDVLVNNAGIAGPTAPVEAFDPGAWDAVMRVNLGATFDVTRLAIPFLRQSAAASVIIMSSVAGRLGYPNRSAYAATKWGLVGFTKTLSRELGEAGIRVNAILPGAVAGARMEQVLKGRAQSSGRSIEEERALAMASQSLQRFVEPADIAALAIFLASDAGKSISGQTVCIDNDMQEAS